MTRVQMAMVGCGAIAPMHLGGIETSGARIDLVAAIDVDPARAEAVAERTGARPFTSLAEARAAVDIDAVDLLLPHHLHEQIAVECFDAGLHVLLEKPMSMDRAACDRIVSAADAAGTVFMVAENAQYWPEVVTVAEQLEAGAIGAVVSARACAQVPPLPDFYGDDAWRFDNQVAGGGLAIDTCSHWIRPLRMWLGEIAEVTAALGRPYQQMEGESLVQALLRFDSGVVATLEAHLNDAPFGMQPMFRVTGTKGELVVTADGIVTLHDAQHWTGVQVGEVGGYHRSYEGAFPDFAAAVLDGREPAATAAYAIGELEAALAIYRSAESGAWEGVGR